MCTCKFVFPSVFRFVLCKWQSDTLVLEEVKEVDGDAVEVADLKEAEGLTMHTVKALLEIEVRQTYIHHRRGGRGVRQNSDRSPQSSRGRELPSKRPQYSQKTLEVADSVSTSSTNSSKHIAEELQPTNSLLPCTKASVNPTAVMPIGTIGHKIMLRAILFTVNISDDLGYIHHYDTQIIPKAPRKVNVTVIDKMVNDNLAIFGRQKVAYDGQKNLYYYQLLIR